MAATMPSWIGSSGAALSTSGLFKPWTVTTTAAHNFQVGQTVLPDHRPVLVEPGDGDRERLLQGGEPGESRPAVPGSQRKQCDRAVAAVPTDDPPGADVTVRRPD